MNKCKNCKHHFYCMSFRYKNQMQDYMEEIYRKPNSTGDIVIWVKKCSKYEPYRPNMDFKFYFYKRINIFR